MSKATQEMSAMEVEQRREECFRTMEMKIIAPFIDRVLDVITKKIIIPQLCGPFGRIMP